MIDTIRRGLIAAILVVAVIGLLPVVPLVFGYTKATTSAATTYPRSATSPPTGTVKVVDCQQSPNPYQVKKDTALSATVKIRCQNNWHYPVVVNVSQGTVNSIVTSIGSGSSALIPAGQAGCVSVTVSSTNTQPNNTNTTISYIGSISNTQANMTATFGFRGSFSWVNNPKNTSQCP